MSTPASDTALAIDLPRFLSELETKLDKGRREYGDVSFSREPSELIDELEQECLDLAGWGFVLWTRLERMKRETLKLEKSIK